MFAQEVIVICKFLSIKETFYFLTTCKEYYEAYWNNELIWYHKQLNVHMQTIRLLQMQGMKKQEALTRQYLANIDKSKSKQKFQLEVARKRQTFLKRYACYEINVTQVFVNQFLGLQTFYEPFFNAKDPENVMQSHYVWYKFFKCVQALSGAKNTSTQHLDQLCDYVISISNKYPKVSLLDSSYGNRVIEFIMGTSQAKLYYHFVPLYMEEAKQRPISKYNFYPLIGCALNANASLELLNYLVDINVSAVEPVTNTFEEEFALQALTTKKETLLQLHLRLSFLNEPTVVWLLDHKKCTTRYELHDALYHLMDEGLLLRIINMLGPNEKTAPMDLSPTPHRNIVYRVITHPRWCRVSILQALLSNVDLQMVRSADAPYTMHLLQRLSFNAPKPVCTDAAQYLVAIDQLRTSDAASIKAATTPTNEWLALKIQEWIRKK